jgi:hypothetical protein
MMQEVAPTARAIRASARLASFDCGKWALVELANFLHAKKDRMARGAARPSSSNQRHWAGNQ